MLTKQDLVSSLGPRPPINLNGSNVNLIGLERHIVGTILKPFLAFFLPHHDPANDDGFDNLWTSILC